MSSPTDEEKNSLARLLPHQIAFLETFFNPLSKRVILLRGEVGLGKTFALVALMSRLLHDRPKARVLFLGSKALQEYMLELLSDTAVPGFIVDRYRYRELIDAVSEGEIWPAGTVVIMSIDFAKQPDIQDSLTAARWELVIADEAHLIRGTRAGAFRKIVACAERVVFATATGQELQGERPYVFPERDATVVEWRRDCIVGHDGRPFERSPSPILHEITFSPSSAELKLRDTVRSLCKIFEDAFGAQNFRAVVLHGTLESSPAALESALQRLVAGSEFLLKEALWETTEDEVVGNLLPDTLDRHLYEKAIEIGRTALQEIDLIDSDSKLDVFSGLLTSLSAAKKPAGRICVLTQYVSTLYYLATEVEGRGIPCLRLHGGMGAEDRDRSLSMFSNEGGVLVATSAVMTEGVVFAEVTELIFYDIPGSKSTLQQVLGRFDRLGRVSQLNIYVFVGSNLADEAVPEALEFLRKTLRSSMSVQSTE